jgi:hypothetical protein
MEKITVKEYAEAVGLTREAIHYQIKQKKVQSKKIKGKFYILVDENFNKKEEIITDSELAAQIELLKQQLKHKEEIINSHRQTIEDKENIIKSKEQVIEADQRTTMVLMKSYEDLKENQALLVENKKKKWLFF